MLPQHLIRIVYVSGRYRHYKQNREFDHTLMASEVAAERFWCHLIAETGHAWIGPLMNSVPVEQDINLPAEEYIERDIIIIRRLRPHFDCILMRPGWLAVDGLPESVGARQEYDAGVDHGLLPIFGKTGVEAVNEYLTRLAVADLKVRS